LEKGLVTTLFALHPLDEEAVTQYRRTLQIKPDFILAHDNLASLLSQQGDLEGAVSHYQ
jgi:hypothetical protein